MRQAVAHIAELDQKRQTIPSRIPVSNTLRKHIIELEPERTLLTNLVKMVPYQVESGLVYLVVTYYKHVRDEDNTLIQFASGRMQTLKLMPMNSVFFSLLSVHS